MYGAILGDIIGSPYERHNIKSKDFPLFSKRSRFTDDTVMTIALDNGAEDFVNEDDCYEIYTTTADFNKVLEAIKAKNLPILESSITMIPQTYVKLEGENAEHMIKLLDELEEHDDVKDVYSNFDISKEDMEKYSE